MQESLPPALYCDDVRKAITIEREAPKGRQRKRGGTEGGEHTVLAGQVLHDVDWRALLRVPGGHTRHLSPEMTVPVY